MTLPPAQQLRFKTLSLVMWRQHFQIISLPSIIWFWPSRSAPLEGAHRLVLAQSKVPHLMSVSFLRIHRMLHVNRWRRAWEDSSSWWQPMVAWRRQGSKEGYWGWSKRGRRNSYAIVQLCSNIARLLRHSFESKLRKLWKTRGSAWQPALYGNYCVAFCELLGWLLWTIASLLCDPFYPPIKGNKIQPYLVCLCSLLWDLMCLIGTCWRHSLAAKLW